MEHGYDSVGMNLIMDLLVETGTEALKTLPWPLSLDVKQNNASTIWVQICFGDSWRGFMLHVDGTHIQSNGTPGRLRLNLSNPSSTDDLYIFLLKWMREFHHPWRLDRVSAKGKRCLKLPKPSS
jgi:glycosidase